jgi:hypothetical protein
MRPGADPGVDRLADIAARSLELASLPTELDEENIVWQLVETPTTVILDSERFATQAVELAEEQQTVSGRPIPPEAMFVPIFGHQYLTLPAQHEVSIELELAVLGDQDVVVMHSLQAVPRNAMPSSSDYREAAEIQTRMYGLAPGTLGMRPLFMQRTATLGITERVVRPNTPFRLRYSYSTGEALERLNARLMARHTRDGVAGLVVRKATLEIRPLAPGRDAEGLVIHEYTHGDADARKVASTSAAR